MRAPAGRRAVPGPVMGWVGGPRSEVPGGLERSQGSWASDGPHQAWAGRGVQHRGSPSTMEFPVASGCFLGLRIRAGRRGRRRWSVREVAARGELSCTADHYIAGGSPHRGLAGPREWIVGVAGSTPVYRRSPLFWGSSWGRVAPCRRRQPFAGPEGARGLILSHRCCTMYVPSTRAVSDGRHPTARGITNSRCRTAPVGRAGRAPRPGWVVVGEGPVEGCGVAFFAIRGAIGGMGGQGVSVTFRLLAGGLYRCDAWRSLRTREPLVTNSGSVTGAVSPGVDACRVRAEANIAQGLSRGGE